MSKVEERVINKIVSRAEVGLAKYGVTVERKDYSPGKWLTELQSELLDGSIYAERLLEFLSLFENVDVDTVVYYLKQIRSNNSAEQLFTFFELISDMDLDKVINELRQYKETEHLT